eukprot:PhF_6_TR11032/c0_g1_i2/m.17886/K00344/qor, CRYZ; NADPH2:quinone reductase
MLRRVLVRAVGGPTAMEIVPELPLSEVKVGLRSTELLVENTVSSFNYIDTYFRSGLYPTPKEKFPITLGQEGAGRVIAAGDTSLSGRIGENVAYFSCINGSYRGYTVVESSKAFAVPDGLSLEVAAASLLQGLTAHYLVCDSYRVKPGDAVVVHAAAGGTGLLVSQMARLKGAQTVIGLCRGADKVQLARTVGKCTHVFDTAQTQNWAEEIRKVCPDGVHAVYDGVGKTTFANSLKCLRRTGSMISFGNASGAVEPLSPLVLAAHGSLYLQRPRLNDYTVTPEETIPRVQELFQWVKDGSVKVHIGKTFPLTDVVKCHEAVESRNSTGKVLLSSKL